MAEPFRPMMRRAGAAAALGLYLVLGLGAYLVPPPARAMDWDHLWLNANQRAARKMRHKDYASAARTFESKRWQAAAWYRAGKYKRAAKAWGRMNDINAHYNRGNALARSGDLKGAAAEYKTVLKRDPGNTDARHNLKVVEKLMQHSPQAGSSSRNQKGPHKGKQQASGRHGKKGGKSANGAGDSQGGKNAPQEAGGSRPGRSQEQKQENSTSQHAGEGDHDESKGDGQTQSAQRDRHGKRSGGERETPPGSEAGRQSRPGATGGHQEQAVSPAAGRTRSRKPEQEAATEQWLRRIPDDPGGLLRRKFKYEYDQRHRGDQQVQKPW